MKPYIFLSENYLHNAQDSNGNDINAIDISTSDLPYTLTVYFADIYGNPTARTIDTLILQDTNIQNLTLAYEKNGAYTTLLSVASNTESTVLVKAENAVTTSSIQITISATNPATVNAKLGVYGFVCNLLALTDSNYKIAANQGDYRVVSGDYIHWADYKKWVGKVKMENLPKDQFDALTAQADKGEMTVVPYTELEATAIYECGVNREYSYELDRKTELFSLTLELNEL